MTRTHVRTQADERRPWSSGPRRGLGGPERAGLCAQAMTAARDGQRAPAVPAAAEPAERPCSAVTTPPDDVSAPPRRRRRTARRHAGSSIARLPTSSSRGTSDASSAAVGGPDARAASRAAAASASITDDTRRTRQGDLVATRPAQRRATAVDLAERRRADVADDDEHQAGRARLVAHFWRIGRRSRS